MQPWSLALYLSACPLSSLSPESSSQAEGVSRGVGVWARKPGLRKKQKGMEPLCWVRSG